MISKCARDGKDTIDAFVSSDESSGLADALGLLGQGSLVIDGQTNRLSPAAQHGATVADVCDVEHAFALGRGADDARDRRGAAAQDALTTQLTVRHHVAVTETSAHIACRMRTKVLLKILRKETDKKWMHRQRSTTEEEKTRTCPDDCDSYDMQCLDDKIHRGTSSMSIVQAKVTLCVHAAEGIDHDPAKNRQMQENKTKENNEQSARDRR